MCYITSTTARPNLTKIHNIINAYITNHHLYNFFSSSLRFPSPMSFLSSSLIPSLLYMSNLILRNPVKSRFKTNIKKWYHILENLTELRKGKILFISNNLRMDSNKLTRETAILCYRQWHGKLVYRYAFYICTARTFWMDDHDYDQLK